MAFRARPEGSRICARAVLDACRLRVVIAADDFARDAHAVVRPKRDHGDVDIAARVPVLAAVALRDLVQRLHLVVVVTRRAVSATSYSPRSGPRSCGTSSLEPRWSDPRRGCRPWHAGRSRR